MSPCQKTILNKSESNKTLLSKGLAIVLKRALAPPKKSSSKKNRRTTRKDQQCKGCEEIAESELGPEVFIDWTRENEECYWNPCLVQSVKSLEYKGFVRPTTLLVGGTDYSLEVVRSAWGRRMLRPPHGYDIVMLGDLDPVKMNLVSQTQFAPLPESLCKVVFDLTSEGFVASLPVITKKLKNSFPELVLPSEEILYRTLGTLIRERKLFHTGAGYAVVTPDTFRLLAMSPPSERQMLLTNEEAIVRLHGTAYTVDDGRTTCTQTQQQEILTAWSSAERILEPTRQGISNGKLKRCHSLKLLRGRDKEKLSRSNSFKSTATSPGNNQDFKNDTEAIKKKSSSMFRKWFRRGAEKKSKNTSSSTQFPPRDWSDPDYVLFNSRATQTLERETKSRSSSLNRALNKDRHSQHLSSTPATPRASHRNRQREANDNQRSSSLSRNPSASPRRDLSSSRSHSKFQEETRSKSKYDSPSFTDQRQTSSHLLASEKYNNAPFNNFYSKVSPYQSTDIIKSQGVFDKPPIILREPTAGWKRPTSWLLSSLPPNRPVDEPTNLQPSVRPRFSSTPKKTSNENNPETSIKTVVDSFKTSESVREAFPNQGKEIRLGTTVDVEISVANGVQNNKTPAEKELSTKNDNLKIATSWNQSIKSNRSKTNLDDKPVSKLTTTTSITTSVSHNKENHRETTTNGGSSPQSKFDYMTDKATKETLYIPGSTVTSDSKSEFFSDSPNTTTEVHLGKDDSGFSSSTSTSRPISVSPC